MVVYKRLLSRIWNDQFYQFIKLLWMAALRMDCRGLGASINYEVIVSELQTYPPMFRFVMLIWEAPVLLCQMVLLGSGNRVCEETAEVG